MGEGPGDGAVVDQGAERLVDPTLELIVPRAHGDRDVPAVLGVEVGDRGQDGLEVRGGVQGPPHVGPEVREVDVAVVERLEGGALVAIEAAELAPLSEPVVGYRAA